MEKKSGKKPETPANGRRNFLKGASGAVIGGALTAGPRFYRNKKRKRTRSLGSNRATITILLICKNPHRRQATQRSWNTTDTALLS